MRPTAAWVVALGALASASCARRPEAASPRDEVAVEPAPACASCPSAPAPRGASQIEPRGVPGSTSLALEAGPSQPPFDRWSTRRIGASDPDEGSPRPKRAKKVDIDLVGAPFDEVARLLADAGRFNVVVEAPGASSVTVRLRDIEPYDALLAIAEVRGIDVRYRRGVVIVGAAKP
ncbi:MAG: hypothetical protein IPG04_07670 [Polyangiaceae bacterium]|nr:hypothetical protein [Polyangiaceae bacterium]